ncbi:hypothetical protein [Streptomyces sp. MST-110588]|uniref:hypothetical protein n=1 Tax=Streptomyces sp. MST-110588 TaxID=2833628 RepID=UPI001F5CB3CA|nr:hypothetical protein [Streptomyces sp. MST-110588]UNO39173.1 hypothetical protein KGS77_05430 [Streptomyces sp. MST-110588]
MSDHSLPSPGPDRPTQSAGPVDSALRGLARREAAAQLLPAPPVGPRHPHLFLKAVPCRDCGADQETLRAYAPAVPGRFASLLHGDEQPPGEGRDNVLSMLGCEVLSVRGFLCAALAGRENGSALHIKTRALALAELTTRQQPATALRPDDLILRIDHDERSTATNLNLPAPHPTPPAPPHPHDPTHQPRSSRPPPAETPCAPPATPHAEPKNPIS